VLFEANIMAHYPAAIICDTGKLVTYTCPFKCQHDSKSFDRYVACITVLHLLLIVFTLLVTITKLWYSVWEEVYEVCLRADIIATLCIQ